MYLRMASEAVEWLTTSHEVPAPTVDRPLWFHSAKALSAGLPVSIWEQINLNSSFPRIRIIFAYL